MKNHQIHEFSKFFNSQKISWGSPGASGACVRARERLLEASYVGCAALKGRGGVWDELDRYRVSRPGRTKSAKS